jgi:hypothetical protein
LKLKNFRYNARKQPIVLGPVDDNEYSKVLVEQKYVLWHEDVVRITIFRITTQGRILPLTVYVLEDAGNIIVNERT